MKEVRVDIECVGSCGIYCELKNEDIELARKARQAGLKIRVQIPEVPEVPPKFEWKDGASLYCNGEFCGEIIIREGWMGRKFRGEIYIYVISDYAWFINHGKKIDTNARVFSCNLYDPTEYTTILAQAKNHLKGLVENCLRLQKEKITERENVGKDMSCSNCHYYSTSPMYIGHSGCLAGKNLLDYREEQCLNFLEKKGE